MIEFNNLGHMYQLELMVGIVANTRCDITLSRTDDQDRLLGGVIYTNYLLASIQVHVASFTPRWLNREFLWFAFSYPFDQLKVKTLYGQVHSENKEGLEFNRKLGFKEVVRLDDFYPTGQLVLFTMKRDECRWLTPPKGIAEGAHYDGQEYHPSTPGHDTVN